MSDKKIRISEDVLLHLKSFKTAMDVNSYDEAIEYLLTEAEIAISERVEQGGSLFMADAEQETKKATAFQKMNNFILSQQKYTQDLQQTTEDLEEDYQILQQTTEDLEEKQNILQQAIEELAGKQNLQEIRCK